MLRSNFKLSHKFYAFASVAMLGLLTGCDPVAPGFTMAWMFDFLVLPVRSLFATGLLAVINNN